MAVAAESAGFASFWMPQVPGYLDAMTAVTVLGQATERIETRVRAAVTNSLAFGGSNASLVFGAPL